LYCVSFAFFKPFLREWCLWFHLKNDSIRLDLPKKIGRHGKFLFLTGWNFYLFFFLNHWVSFSWNGCSKPGKWAVVYLRVRGIDLTSFCDFDIWFWNCSDSVVFFVFHCQFVQIM
jgi:hypothetical protein